MGGGGGLCGRVCTAFTRLALKSSEVEVPQFTSPTCWVSAGLSQASTAVPLPHEGWRHHVSGRVLSVPSPGGQTCAHLVLHSSECAGGSVGSRTSGRGPAPSPRHDLLHFPQLCQSPSQHLRLNATGSPSHQGPYGVTAPGIPPQSKPEPVGITSKELHFWTGCNYSAPAPPA